MACLNFLDSLYNPSMKEPVLFQNQPVREIGDAENRILVSPGHGARILLWQHKGREVIRWPADADWGHILKVRGGNPVLFPFIARHFVDGKKDLWRDEHGTMRPMAQHGFARDAAFAVIEHTNTELRLRLTDSEATRASYPFAFQFDVVVRLSPGSRLEIGFETTKTGPTPVPYYAGHHFYLAIPHTERAQWTLRLPCESWARQRPDGAMVHEEPTSDLLRLDDPAIIDRMQVQPKDATVTLANETTAQRLVFDLSHVDSVPWYAVTTWTEKPDSDFYCIEPWLGLPNAIHHGEGLRHVAPGMTERAACVLDASAW
jgi:galactose mutarotase-like enzyme